MVTKQVSRLVVGLCVASCGSVGIFGSSEGLYNHPDGIFMPAPKPRWMPPMQSCPANGAGTTTPNA